MKKIILITTIGLAIFSCNNEKKTENKKLMHRKILKEEALYSFSASGTSSSNKKFSFSRPRIFKRRYNKT